MTVRRPSTAAMEVLRWMRRDQAHYHDPSLIDQVPAASFAKAPEIWLPRAPNVFGPAPRLDRRPQLRARRQPIETLGAKLKLRQMRRAHRHEHRDRELGRIVRRAIAHAQLEPVEYNPAVFAVGRRERR